MASLRVTMLLGIVLVSGIASTQAQLSQVLAVAGETLNKAGEAAMDPTPRVPKNFQKPQHINSYAQYLKYAGEATGILPVEPEADSPSVAPGPSADDSALAPATAMAGMGQPSLQSQGQLQNSFEQNYDPTIQDWANAYKPVDKALNKAFETRITNDNARQVQFQLAVAAAPLQMLINDQVVKQGDEAKSFMSGIFGNLLGATAKKGGATDASSISANPLTGTAITAPTAEAPAPTAVQGSTVTVANPAATSAAATAPAAGTTAAAPVGTTAAAPVSAAAATPVTAATATPTTAAARTVQQSQASQNPLTSLFSFPTFGRRKLLAN